MYVCYSIDVLCMQSNFFYSINFLYLHLSVLYGVSARMIRHLKFLHKNPDVMIHIRAYEEYDGNQEKHGAKSFRDGVHTYIQYIHVFPHTKIHTYLHTYAYT